MPQRYDLFKIERGGDPLWLGATDSVDEAKEQAKQHSDSECDFCVMDQQTGERIGIARSELA